MLPAMDHSRSAPETSMKKNELGFQRIQRTFGEIFGLGRSAALTAVFLAGLVCVLAVYWFIHLAPPDTITITSGPEGSIFRRNSERYAKILARNGVKLRILPSEGSLQNLERLTDPSVRVDIGFVQGGLVGGLDVSNLVSLGSVYNEPLLIFYRSPKPIDLLSGFSGRRLAIGRAGSGTRALALALLQANGITPGGPTRLPELEADDAAEALIKGTVDAVFLAGDSASIDVIRKLNHALGVRMFSFSQADAYTRRITYLNKMELPQGAIDFGKNIPARDVSLVGPTVELIARSNLHPALSDLLLEAAREVHGRAGLFRRQGEFPAPQQHEFQISPEALSFYKSGKSFLYRYLPFWVASVMNRVLVVFIPTIVLMIPAMRAVPALYRWKVSLGIYRWYRQLMLLEREVIEQYAPEKRVGFLERLDHIERAVNRMKVPASFADRFYELRGHIGFVRGRLLDRTGEEG